MAVISWFQKKFVFVPFILLVTFVIFLYKTCNKSDDLSLLLKTKEQLELLENKLKKFELQHISKIKINENVSNEPVIYFVTPTFSRYTQQADLVRLSNTLKHVQNLHWILIEDAETTSSLVANILKSSGLTYTHLNVHTQKKLKLKKNDPRWKRHRGVDQRNMALSWIRKNISLDTKGVLYFGDDDNTYHVDLFSEMRYTKKVSMWPVALVGGLRFEGPVCKNGKVTKFFTAWMPNRQFPVDMAAFGLNINLIFENPSANINPEVQRGFLETDFLQQLKLSKEDVEAKAVDCSKILVWHTQTAEPKMKEEIKLSQQGEGSNPAIII